MKIKVTSIHYRFWRYMMTLTFFRDLFGLGYVRREEHREQIRRYACDANLTSEERDELLRGCDIPNDLCTYMRSTLLMIATVMFFIVLMCCVVVGMINFILQYFGYFILDSGDLLLGLGVVGWACVGVTLAIVSLFFTITYIKEHADEGIWKTLNRPIDVSDMLIVKWYQAFHEKTCSKINFE